MDHRRRNTLALKGISVILGILLWLFVTNENVIVTHHTVSGVSVKSQNLDAGLKAVYNNTVDLEVTANSVDRSAYEATIDLSGMGVGKHQVPVRVKTPSGVKLVKVAPAQLTVNILEVNEKVVPVGVRLDKEPPEGFKVTGMVPSPSQVLARGSYSDLQQVTEARAKIDLSAIKASAVVPLTLMAVDRDGIAISSVKVVPDQGEVYVVVEAEKKESSLPVKVELKGYLPANYTIVSIASEPNEVKVFGSQDILTQTKEAITEPVEVDNITESVIREVKLASLPGIVFDPSSVIVKIEIKPGSANP